MNRQISLATICAVLAVFGAGALQVGIAVALLTDPGVRIAFIIAIAAAIVMDALVIQEISTKPTNNKQKGAAIVMLLSLFAGLSLDVVLLLTSNAFTNETFGWLRALVGVNIALSLVAACVFFAFSDTNTHERQLKQLKHKVEMSQANDVLSGPHAAKLYRAKFVAEMIAEVANDLGIPVYRAARLLGLPEESALLDAPLPEETSGATRGAPLTEAERAFETNGDKQTSPFR